MYRDGLLTEEYKGIQVTLLAHSVNKWGNEVLTFESVYPRFVHAQRLKHRNHSVNTSSSRAIRLDFMADIIRRYPAIPVKFGKNQSGMVAGDLLDDVKMLDIWLETRDAVLVFHEIFQREKLHKEIANRILEPWMTVKEVSSGTEWNNAYNLRAADPAAQGEIEVLFKLMLKLKRLSEPVLLKHGEWHLPYVKSIRSVDDGVLRYYDSEGYELDVETAKAISSSCCAQVSYRKLNDTKDKATDIYNKLMPENGNLHATPFEHPCTPFSDFEYYRRRLAKAISGDNICMFKGNFQGWTQHRKEFKRENNTNEPNIEIAI